MLLRKHKAGRKDYRSEFGSSQKAHKAGKVLPFLPGKCDAASQNEGTVRAK